RFVSADPTARSSPDKWYLPALKIEGDVGSARLISNTSFYHRENQTGYDGTLYNLGYYQTQNAAPIFLYCSPPAASPCPPSQTLWTVPYPLLDGAGLHVPVNYRSPSTIDNGQENLTQEIRLQSTDPNARLLWTTGVFFSENRQTYLEQIHDPRAGTGNDTENAFTPKVSLQFQLDPNNMFYTTYAKGFRPGGANNPIPDAACPTDFANFGITANPPTFSSDTVRSFEVGAKNNFSNRLRLATSVYYIKWDNIQQLIVPPVCQISFIANTGRAVAKGADLQADFAVTSGLSAELAL